MQLQDTLAYPKAQREDKAFIQGLHASLIPHEEDFPPMPEPDEYDWLYARAAKGQSFRSFVQNHAKRQPKPGANKIYLLPIVEQVGEHALARFPDVETLRSMVEAFYSLPTIILKPVSMAGLGGRIGTRNSSESGRSWKQYNANNILGRLRSRKPSDGHTLCAFTMHDIFKPSFNYLFGLHP